MERFNAVSLTIYYYLCILYYFLPERIKLYYGIILLIYASTFLLKFRRISNKPIPYFSIVFVSFLFVQLLNERFLFSSFYLLMNSFLVYYILHSRFCISTLYKFFYLFSIIFSIPIVLGYNPDYLLVGTSRNFISVFFISYSVLIYIICLLQKETIKIYPAIISFFFALWAVGRSGIICSGILVSYMLFSTVIRANKGVKFLAVFFVFCFLFIVLSVDYEALAMDYEVVFRFMYQGVESHERDMLKEQYLNELNLKTFFLGYNYSTDPLFISLGGNPHNSYIRFHSSVGFLFVPFFVLVIISLIRSLFNNRFVFILLLVLLLRGWTDIVYLMDKFDFVIFILIYIGLNAKKK